MTTYYIDLSATAQVASKTLGFCDPHIELAKWSVVAKLDATICAAVHRWSHCAAIWFEARDGPGSSPFTKQSGSGERARSKRKVAPRLLKILLLGPPWGPFWSKMLQTLPKILQHKFSPFAQILLAHLAVVQEEHVTANHGDPKDGHSLGVPQWFLSGERNALEASSKLRHLELATTEAN